MMDELIEILRSERLAVERRERWLFERVSHESTNRVQFDALVQRSDGWIAARKQRLTASRFGVIAELSKYADAYALWELLTGAVEVGADDDPAGNPHIQRGVTQESLAIRGYENAMKCTVNLAGFYVHKHYDYLGASPDGLLPDGRGLVEIKCPARATTTEISDEYMAQVQGQLEICDREYCDFCTWHMSTGLQIVRVYRSKAYW